MPALATLSLHNVQLGDVGLARLTQLLPSRLRRLHLGSNDLTDTGLSALHGLGLSALALGGNSLSPDAINRLLESVPGLKWLQLGPQPRRLRDQLKKDYPSVEFDFHVHSELPA
jgi:hypothetical protein